MRAIGAQRCRPEDGPPRLSEPRRTFRLDREAATVELYKALLKAGGLIKRELLSPTLLLMAALPLLSKRGYQGHPFAS